MIRLSGHGHEAEIAIRGAELQALRWLGLDLLWDGDPAWWGRRAPVLFPIVGRLADDTLRHGGRARRMAQHGFARDLEWEVTEAAGASARLRLRDSDATREPYPFRFELAQRFELGAEGLRITLTLSNPGSEPLPASLGLHPAFRWPLPGGRREDHALVFEQEETAPARRLRKGLLSPEAATNPIDRRILRLEDALFAEGALIFDRLRSRRLTFTAPGAPVVGLAWDFPHLGIWTKPGAPFLCLEPWQGFADPEGFSGSFEDKPGLILVPPGESRGYALSIQAREALP